MNWQFVHKTCNIDVYWHTSGCAPLRSRGNRVHNWKCGVMQLNRRARERAGAKRGKTKKNLHDHDHDHDHISYLAREIGPLAVISTPDLP